MDVERIQKINNMALNLLNQGLASSRDEAVLQAEKFYKGTDGTENYADIRNRMATPTVEERRNSHSDLSQDQIKEILEKNSVFLVKTIKEFQEKILAMEGEITRLRGVVQSGATTVREMMSHQQTQAPQPSSEQRTAEAPKAPASHPRSGNYKDTDVSIEKFFYMGKK